jgi:hypothetical protein
LFIPGSQALWSAISPGCLKIAKFEMTAALCQHSSVSTPSKKGGCEQAGAVTSGNCVSVAKHTAEMNAIPMATRERIFPLMLDVAIFISFAEFNSRQIYHQ